MAEILELPISPKYARHWDTTDGLREIVANALDTHTKVSMNLDGNTLIIHNESGELTRSNFVMGGTEKEGTNTIGQFGEGLKVGAMVLCRVGKVVRGQSGDFRFTFKMEFSEKWDSEILNIRLETVPFQEGTTVEVFPIEREEYRNLRDIFLFTHDNRILKVKTSRGEIYSGGHGEIYCHGIRISDDYFKGSTLSFNFFGLKLNRDRTIFNDWEIRSIVGEIIPQITDSVVAEEIFLMLLRHEKMQSVGLYDNPKNKHVWMDAARKHFELKKGAPLGLAKSDIEIRLLKEWGFNPIPCANTYFSDWLHNTLGIKMASEALGHAAEYDIVPENKLTYLERKNLATAQSYARSIIRKSFDYDPKKTKIWVFSKRMDTEADSASIHTGVYKTKDDSIGIRQSQLDSVKKATLTLVHEYVHAVSGYDDNTRGFEISLEQVIGSFL